MPIQYESDLLDRKTLLEEYLQSLNESITCKKQDKYVKKK